MNAVLETTQQIRERAVARLEELCLYLLPGGHKEGSHWRAGNINGDPGKSFDVNLTTGQFGDWAAGDKMQTGPINLWMQAKGLDFNTARAQLAQWLGMSVDETSAPKQNGQFDWSDCVNAMAGSNMLREVATWRGFSREFCDWLVDRKEIGLFHNAIAFPIRGQGGKVLSPHYLKSRPKDWKYFKGTRVCPFIIGNLKDATEVHVHESTWDGLAFYDRIDAHRMSGICVIVTRGAKNAKLLKGLIPTGKKVYVWPQNDKPDEQGTVASEEWFRGIKENLEGSFWRVETPTEFSDLNDWTRGGATKADLVSAIAGAESKCNGNDAVTQQSKVCAYYDIFRKEYLLQNAAGRWHSYDQAQFKLQLRSRGIRRANLKMR
jgi:hypothetical protein